MWYVFFASILAFNIAVDIFFFVVGICQQTFDTFFPSFIFLSCHTMPLLFFFFNEIGCFCSLCEIRESQNQNAKNFGRIFASIVVNQPNYSIHTHYVFRCSTIPFKYSIAFFFSILFLSQKCWTPNGEKIHSRKLTYFTIEHNSTTAVKQHDLSRLRVVFPSRFIDVIAWFESEWKKKRRGKPKSSWFSNH